MATRAEVEELAKQLTPDEKRAFGVDHLLARKSWTYHGATDVVYSLAMNKLKNRERQTTPATESKGETQMAKAEVQENRITDIVRAEPAEVAGPIVITSGALGELAAAITASIGQTLHENIAVQIEKASSWQNITDATMYLGASEHRKLLRSLIAKKGEMSDPNRFRVRVSLGIMDGVGQRIAVAAETTVGTVSLDDLYGPLAGLLDKLHKATTQGRAEAAERIEMARAKLEGAVLRWQDEQERRKREAEVKQRLINEQLDRTDRAKHWMTLLVEHGYQLETLQSILDNPIDQVTDLEVNTLENLLREKLLAEEKAKQDAELAEAIQTAKNLGRQDAVEILEGKMNEPVVVAAPPPPPAPVARPVSTAVAQAETPKVKGQGKQTVYDVKIDDPRAIPAEWLLPPDEHLLDPDWYPRIKKAASGQGTALKIPGITITPRQKLTQR
jgi:hypothetical protein